MKGPTALLADSRNPNSLASKARRRRWAVLSETFPDFEQMRVVDLGGVVGEWQSAPIRPADLTILNLFEQPANGTIHVLVGDACVVPAELEHEHFDLVFSNSVIDQVGGHYRRLRFAEVVAGLSDRHWIQTAYRYFPVDPVTLFPAQQLLPLRARAAVTRHWPLGYRHADSDRDSVMMNLGIEGLSKTALRAYFPESEIVSERSLGMTKSLIAVKR